MWEIARKEEGGGWEEEEKQTPNSTSDGTLFTNTFCCSPLTKKYSLRFTPELLRRSTSISHKSPTDTGELHLQDLSPLLQTYPSIGREEEMREG